jgi:hypothetical protein
MVPLATSCGSPVSPSHSAAPELAVFDKGGLVLRYPAAWHRFDYEMVTSMTDLFGYLATVPVDNPCHAIPNGTECGPTPYDLQPGTLVVRLGTRFQFPNAAAEPMDLVIGGMPASLNVSGAGDGQQLNWEVAFGPGALYTINADLRGPGLAAMRSEVEAMVAGLEFNPPIARLPNDPERLAEGAQAALRVALTTVRETTPEASCFPDFPGATRQATVLISGTPDMRDPVAVRCSTRVEASPLQLWKVVLTIELEEPTADLGQSVITVWMTPDNKVTQTEESRGP